MQFTVSPQEDGLTLRALLQMKLHPSSKMLKFIKYRENGITVNGEQKTVRFTVKTGDFVCFFTEDEGEQEQVLPVELPLQILYEDDDVVVPSKPADMPTHPSHNHHDDTVANALAYLAKKQNRPFLFRPINRLDRNTSGLLLIAKNKLSAGRLSEEMKKGEIRKNYLAILDGEMQTDYGEIHKALHRTRESIILREVCELDAPDADDAITKYAVLAVGNGHTLVKASPITGRTHQLRVHFAYLGFPITGDDLYGNASQEIGRHALHAESLRFLHPSTGEHLTIHAPLPTDMQNLIAAYFPKIHLQEVLYETTENDLSQTSPDHQ